MTELNLSHKQCHIPSRMLSAAVCRFGNSVVKNALQLTFKFWLYSYILITNFMHRLLFIFSVPGGLSIRS